MGVFRPRTWRLCQVQVLNFWLVVIERERRERVRGSGGILPFSPVMRKRRRNLPLP